MKAIISTTYDDKYLFFLPIVCFTWNKLGVSVICFMPYLNTSDENKKIDLINDTLRLLDIKIQYAGFASSKDKEATYAQVSRLYAACLDLPEDEILVTSDCDMILFKNPMPDFGKWNDNEFKIFGADLVPEKQFPICYIGGSVKSWRDTFDLRGKTYQQKLDSLLGKIKCDNMRGNYWAKDQEEAYNKIPKTDSIVFKRAKEGTQFSSLRYDRDDSFLLDRLSPDTIDFHMPRPGFVPTNFEIILKVLQYHYPEEGFQWLIDYTNEYKKLL